MKFNGHKEIIVGDGFVNYGIAFIQMILQIFIFTCRSQLLLKN